MPPRSKRAARAMGFLAETDPALASLALWCDVHDGSGDTCTKGQTILIGHGFDALPLREQVGVLGHHILHVALRHGARMGGMRHRLGKAFATETFNLAADALVNEVLDHAGHALPRPAVTLTSLLREVLQTDTDRALATWDAERLYLALNALERSGRGRREEYETKTAFKPDLGEDGQSEAGDEAVTWQSHVARALQTPGAAGRGVGTVLARALDLPRVETPWEVHLRGLLAKAAQQTPRRSFRRPRAAWVAAEAEARRTGGPAPVFEPGQARNQRRPRIVVGLDSSGSVGDVVLSLFAAEVAGIARRSGAQTHLLCFDETVYDHLVLEPDACEAALTSVEFRREGGTSFVDVLDKAKSIDPSIAVILTDLDGPCGAPPPFDVVWATPRPTWSEPPFGKVLSLAR
ncbi:MAG: VWA-like domain-containing protein [Pseudomonadota bacterium]